MPNIVAKVVALKPHTAFGQSHDTGDTYELDEEFVANVLAQGMVRRAVEAPLKTAAPAATTPRNAKLKPPAKTTPKTKPTPAAKPKAPTKPKPTARRQALARHRRAR